MRRFFPIIFWSIVLLALSGVLISTVENYISSLLLSFTILPGVIAAKYFWRDISFKNRWQGIYHLILLALLTLLIEYMAILCVDILFFSYGLNENSAIVFNPFFIWMIVVSFLSLEKVVEYKFKSISGEEFPEFITFITERRKITVPTDSIEYIESNDDEVWVRAVGNVSYRTKMNITHWQMVLDSRFIRIHRSYLVNRSRIDKITPNKLWIGSTELEISRKHKDNI